MHAACMSVVFNIIDTQHHACAIPCRTAPRMCVYTYVHINRCVGSPQKIRPQIKPCLCLCMVVCVCVFVCVCVCKGISYVHSFSFTRIRNKEEIKFVVSTIAYDFVFSFSMTGSFIIKHQLQRITDAGGKRGGSWIQ